MGSICDTELYMRVICCMLFFCAVTAFSRPDAKALSRLVINVLEARYPGLATVLIRGASWTNSDYGVTHIDRLVLQKNPDTIHPVAEGNTAVVSPVIIDALRIPNKNESRGVGGGNEA